MMRPYVASKIREWFLSVSVVVMPIKLDCRSCYVANVGRSKTFLFFFSLRWFEAPHPHVSTTTYACRRKFDGSSLECNPAVWTLLVGPLCALTTCMHRSSGQFWGNLRWAWGSSARRGGKCRAPHPSSGSKSKERKCLISSTHSQRASLSFPLIFSR